ncbi:MAG: hypothetical protein AAGH41_05025 [Pseudomonadota bacterium]
MKRILRELSPAALGFLATLWIIACTDLSHILFAWRMDLSEHSLTVLTDVGLMPVLFTEDGALWVEVLSWAGWLACYFLLVRWGRAQRIAFLCSPAPLILALGGLGVTVMGLIIMFEALGRLAENRTPENVPLVGLAILCAACMVPFFELLVLAVASPLFLFAPPEMLRSNMRAFYLVTLSPALVLLTAAAGYGGDFTAAPADTREAGQLLAAAPPVVGALLAVFAAARSQSWPITVLAIALVTAALLSHAVDPLWALCLAGFFAAYAGLARRSLALQFGQVTGVTIALLLYSRQIPSL